MQMCARFTSVLLTTIAFAQAGAAGPPSVVPQVSDAAATTKKLTDILDKQVQAWNAADIPEFMTYYWKSDKLTFSSGGTTRRGWQATLESYQKKYPTPEKMGQLRFSNLEADLLGKDVALVLGNWHLKRNADPDIGGNFSLVFRKIESRWLIIHDHSSSLKKD